MHLQPGVSHPSIYIDTNGQPSALPDVEGSAAPRLPGQSPDPAGVCEYGRGEGQGGSGTAGTGTGTGCWEQGGMGIVWVRMEIHWEGGLSGDLLGQDGDLLGAGFG